MSAYPLLRQPELGNFGRNRSAPIASGQSDPGLLDALYEQIVEPNIKGCGEWIAFARHRNELRAEADVQTLRDVL